MGFRTVEAPRDKGNHAVTIVGDISYCVFCGLSDVSPITLCAKRAKVSRQMNYDAFEAIWKWLHTNGTEREPIVFSDEGNARKIEIGGSIFQPVDL